MKKKSTMKKKLTSFSEAEQSPTKWKKFLSESKTREKSEMKFISKGLKKSAKRAANDAKNPRLQPKDK